MKYIPRAIAPALATMLLCCGVVKAADVSEAPQATSGEQGWTFTAAPYLWVAGIDGTIGQSGLPPVDVDASFSDIMKHFDVGVMGAAEARYGRLGFATDLQYIKVSADADTPKGLLFDRLEVTSKTLSVFGAAMWRAVETPTVSVDLMAGARLWSVETRIDPVGGPLGVADFSSTETWVDPVVGAKGRVELPSNFYLTGWGMFGGFGVSSKASWDVMGAVGYEVTDATSFMAGYRALGVDYKHGDFLFDVVQSGPILGALIKF